LACFLYGRNSWALVLKGEYRLTVFEKRVMRDIFGPKRDEITGELRRLHYEELYDLHSSLNTGCFKKSFSKFESV
jgi:hypothetical protein